MLDLFINESMIKKNRECMGHVTHMNESCHTCESVMSHM